MFARSSSFELDGTDTGDLAEGKSGKLGLEIHNQLAHWDGK